MTLDLPQKPTGFTRKMTIHYNFGGGKGAGLFEIFDPNGKKMPFGYQYDTQKGGLTGFTVPDDYQPRLHLGRAAGLLRAEGGSMSKLRPECRTVYGHAMPDTTALFLIRDAVLRRRELIHGRLHNGAGGHCAIGAFWDDNPGAVLNSSLIDEVAAVNDSMCDATPQQRWKKVSQWLRWKVRVLAGATK